MLTLTQAKMQDRLARNGACKISPVKIGVLRGTRERAVCASAIGAVFFQDSGDVTQQLQIQRRRHVVPFAQTLQSLELIHGLEELAVDRRLVAGDGVYRRPRERLPFLERISFVPGCDAEPPVRLGDFFYQHLFHTDRLQVFLQAFQQVGELLPGFPVNQWEALRQ